MAGAPRRPRRNGRLARGSHGPLATAQREWITDAVRARFPKVAAALGDSAFELMMGAYLEKRPREAESLRESTGLADFLSGSPDYPVWYGELAELDRAHVDVLHVPAGLRLTREALTPELELNLIPAHKLVELTTTADELWHALDAGAPPVRPRSLDYPRSVLVWRASGLAVCDRTLDADEARALHAVTRGATLMQLTNMFAGENPAARALDVVLRWIESGVIATPMRS
jgi:hypothetical protein